MNDFELTLNWPNEAAAASLFDSDEEPIAELSLAVTGQNLTTLFDQDRQTTSDSLRMNPISLACGIADNWWTILYEPQKRDGDKPFFSRHRLDALTGGYVFPPLALWSGGDTVIGSLQRLDGRFNSVLILLPSQSEPWALERGTVERALGGFVSSVIEHTHDLKLKNYLSESWERVVSSNQDPEMRVWCVNAGRLGIDPYDLDGPDLNRIADGLADSLFGELCDATELNELTKTCEWVRNSSYRLQNAPTVSVKDFGAAPKRDLSKPGWGDGYDCARLLRKRLSLPKDPTKAIGQMLHGADIDPKSQLGDNAPPVVEGLATREGTSMRAAVPAKSDKQRRWRLCRTTYLAWRGGNDANVATTTADTWRQRASRAFAAELLAPADLLKERAGATGLTQDVVERISSEWQCPEFAITHQAENHGIRLRGISRGIGVR